MAKYKVDGVTYNIPDEYDVNEVVDEIRATPQHWADADYALDKRTNTVGRALSENGMPFTYEDRRTEAQALDDAMKDSAWDRARKAVMYGGPEVLTQMVTGLGAQAAGGVTGSIAGTAAALRDDKDPMQAFRDVSEATAHQFTYQPRSDMGRVMGDLAGHGFEGARNFSGDLGERLFDPDWRSGASALPNSPIGRTLGEVGFDTLTTVLPPIALLKGLRGARLLRERRQLEADLERHNAELEAKQLREHQAQVQADLDNRNRTAVDPNLTGDFPPERGNFLEIERSQGAPRMAGTDQAPGTVRLAPAVDANRFSLEERLQHNADELQSRMGGPEPSWNDPNGINFPQRLEVLDSPQARMQLDMYQRNIAAYEAAGKTAEAEALRQKFGQWMESMGVRSPQDATGLARPFWEGESKFPIEKTERPEMGDQRGTGPTAFNMMEGWLDESRLAPVDAPRNLMTDQPSVSRRNRSAKEVAEQGPDKIGPNGEIVNLGIGIDAVEWARKYGKEVTDKINKLFDPEHGIGAMPINHDIDQGRTGMVRYVKPSEFLKLARPLRMAPGDHATVRFLKGIMEDGTPVGNPYLRAIWNQAEGRWNIDGHEGRHRAMALKSMFNDTPVPVHFNTLVENTKPNEHINWTTSRLLPEDLKATHREAGALNETKTDHIQGGKDPYSGTVDLNMGIDPVKWFKENGKQVLDTMNESDLAKVVKAFENAGFYVNPKTPREEIAKIVKNNEDMALLFQSVHSFNGPRLDLGQLGGRQRGAIDFNIFKETYADFKKKITKEFGEQPDAVIEAMWQERQNPPPVLNDAVDTRQNLTDIPGLRDALKDILVDTQPLVIGKDGKGNIWNEELKKQLDAVVDLANHQVPVFKWTLPVGESMRQLISGATNVGRLYGNKAISYVADLVNDAVTRYESLGHKFTASKEHGATEAINHLSKEQQTRLWKDVILPFEGKRDLSLADLKQFNLSPVEIDAYMKMRAALQYVFEEVNKLRESQGMEPIERRPGYFPAKFVGDYFIQVWSDGDKKNLIGLYSANNKDHIKRVEAHIRHDYPEYTISEIQERNPWARRRESASVWTVMNDIQQTLKEGDPRAAALADLLEKYENDTMRYHKGVWKHFKPGGASKEKVAGSSGRDPLLSDHENAQMAFRAMHDYIEQSLEFIEFSKIAPSVNAVLNPHTFPNIPNAQKYLQQYWDRARGIPSKIAQAQYDTVSAIAHAFGVQAGGFKSGMAMLKPQVLLMMLGYNTPRFLIAQFLQPNQFLTQQMLSLKARGVDIGYGDMIQAWGKGIYHAYQLAKGREYMEAHAKRSLEWAENNNIVDPHMFEDIKTDLQRRSDGAWSYFNGEKSIRWTEKKARLQTFLTFADLLNKEGLTFKEQMETAAKLTRQTMVDYRPFEKPLLYQNLGIFGDMISPLKTFTHNYYTQMAIGINEFMKANWKDKPHYAAPVIMGLAMQQIFSGLMGLPGREDADGIIGWAKKLWPKFPDATQAILQGGYGLDPKNKTGRNYITHGISSVTGLDMSPTFAAGQLIPDKLDAWAPIIGKAWDVGSALGAFAFNRTDGSGLDVLKQVTPNAYQWALEMGMQRPGGQIPNPSRNMKADITRSTDKLDPAWIARYLGSRSIDESREKALVYEEKKEQTDIKERKALLMNRAYEDWQANKPIEKYVQELATYGVTPNETYRTLMEKHKDRMLTEKQRLYGGVPKNLQQIEKYKDVQRYK